MSALATAVPRRIRTALFVDFDNVFGGLLCSDRTAAFAFGEQPELWLKRFETYDLSGARRDLLVRRAYLNPEGSVPDRASKNSTGRVLLSRFRSNLTRAGFEVVDCPPLCASQKNAADIRMVLDARDLLDVPVTYDEFVIASSDSDFTPLINRIRALDRRTVIITTGKASSAYRSVAHQVLDGTDVAALVRTKVSQPEPAGAADEHRPARKKAISVIRGLITSSAEPVNLSEVGNVVRAAVTGVVVDESKWFGERSLAGFMRALPDGFVIDGQYARHPGAAAVKDVAAAPGQPAISDLPPVVMRSSELAQFPKIDRTAWRPILETLATYADTHEFDFVESTAWTRDSLVEAGLKVGRKSVVFASRALTDYGQVPLIQAVAGGIDGCIAQIVAVVRARVTSAGGEFSDEDEFELRVWMGAAKALPNPKLTRPPVREAAVAKSVNQPA